MTPSSSSPPKPKHKSRGKRWRASGRASVGIVTEDIKVQQSTKRRGRRKPATSTRQLGETGTSHDRMSESNSKASTSLPTTVDRGAATRSMFGDNVAIFGGNFTQGEKITVVDERQTDPFQLLKLRVATSAFHNSAERFDPPRCHPNTRVAILRDIVNWLITSADREQWILWLNGAAGAGKSAIMLSIVERCIEEAIAFASFFFFRADSTRNTIAPLIATLAYQLHLAIPETSASIFNAIKKNPLIFDQSVESQLNQLIVEPLLCLPSNLRRLFVVFIDGLDECNDRTQQSCLIKSLGSISRSRTTPVTFILASRREPQIEAVFMQRPVFQIFQTLSLDNSDLEQTSDDIRRFLKDKFKEIKESHLHRTFLPPSWPSPNAVEEIVAKSSGQFIYASVVMNYISSPHGHPALQLDVINGIRPRTPSQNPFAHLDALYQYIFSQVNRLDTVRNILAFILATASRQKQDISFLRAVFQLESGELEVYFSDLASVIEVDHRNNGQPADPLGELRFLHASLPDFLTDKSRSEDYYIDVDDYRTKLLCTLLERPPPTVDLRLFSSFNNVGAVLNEEVYRFIAIKSLIEKAKPSERLQNVFMKFSFRFKSNEAIVQHCFIILKFLERLNFNDQGAAYLHFKEQVDAENAKVQSEIDTSFNFRSQIRNSIYGRMAPTFRSPCRTNP